MPQCGGFRKSGEWRFAPGHGRFFLLTLRAPGQTVPELWSFGRIKGVFTARVRVKPPSRKHVAVAR
jgi:hypothetical protein